MNSDEIDERDEIRATTRGDNSDVAENPATGLVAAELAGVNMGLSTNITGAPATGARGEVDAASDNYVEDAEGDKLNLDALEQFGSKGRESGDEGVSAAQSELEADEQNG